MGACVTNFRPFSPNSRSLLVLCSVDDHIFKGFTTSFY